MKHVFTVTGLGLAALFVVVFFAGRLDSKHLAAVAPRVGMEVQDLSAIAPRIASQTGATIGTSRRVVYLLACSGLPDRSTMEARALEAASITETQRMTAREATVLVLSGGPREDAASLLKDC